MMPERLPGDPRLSRISLRKELVAEGIHDRAIAALLADGTLHRVRHGAYVSGAAWRSCDDAGRHDLRARAVLRQARAEVVLSHTSAVCAWDVPLWDTDLETVHVTRVDQRTGRREAGVRQHAGELRKGDVVDLHGCRITSATRSAMDSLTVLDAEQGLAVVNSLLHRGLTTHEALWECAEFMELWPGTLNHNVVLRLADGRCESVGESRTFYLCWRQGLPSPQPQFAITDRAGRVIARVDFAWPKLGVFLEFDGRVKYHRFLRQGESPSDAVVREKKREEMICELTGWRCIRIDWADLYRPDQTAARIRAMFRQPATAPA